jgi:PiT family inorganic phosphate transporter
MVSILLLIVLALVFDFLNGFHDSANSIATIVSTRVLTPRRAVVWAASFNFIAFLFFGLHVANTIGKGIIDINIVDKAVIFATLIGACTWDVITWYLGLPTSSSHALIGGMIGAALMKVGVRALVWSGITKSTPRKVDHLFRKGQLLSAALYSMGHGGNDAQKTMGIITVLLFSAGWLKGEFHVPLYVVLLCHAAIALGTMFGGWRIVKTMGQKVAKLKPVDGFSAESSAALTLAISSGFGIPVSTTHTITGAIMGVGSLRRLSAVRWGVAYNIVWAWILTIPAAAFIAALAYLLAGRLLANAP